jgi:uncharacterized lipoprotein YmbA
MTPVIARWLIAGSLLLAACSSVEVPSERFYRLAPPPVSPPDPQQGGILRVQDLQLQTALDSACLLRLDGVRLWPSPLARWVAPLDRLVTDALVLGLSRARVCELVKGSADPGDETWSLRGRIVDFVEATHGQERAAKVALELWLEGGTRVLFHDEFVAEEPIHGVGEDAAVDALSRGLARVVGDIVARMRGQDLFASARAATATADAKALAAPIR